MRIVGGLARGRRLKVPRGGRVRPTAAKVKQAVFHMVAGRFGLQGAWVLDLFAGSGSLGIEALSRGATGAVFVEPRWKVRRVIAENLGASDFSSRGRILGVSAARALQILATEGLRFDGIFLDPPYEGGWVEKILAALSHSSLVKEKTWVVAEHSRREEPAGVYGRLLLADRRYYGGTAISLYVAQDRR